MGLGSRCGAGFWLPLVQRWLRPWCLLRTAPARRERAMRGQAIAAPRARISSPPRMAPARPGPVMPGQAIAPPQLA